MPSKVILVQGDLFLVAGVVGGVSEGDSAAIGVVSLMFISSMGLIIPQRNLGLSFFSRV
jgi:hypothetical protein